MRPRRPFRSPQLLMQVVVAGWMSAAFALPVFAHTVQQAAPPVAPLAPLSVPKQPPSDNVPPAASLPNAPSTVFADATLAANPMVSGPDIYAENYDRQTHTQQPTLPPCPADAKAAQAASGQAQRAPCVQDDPFRAVVNSNQIHPLSSTQKGYLAVREVIDPGNLIVLTAQAGVTVAANSHTAYGPGFKGFGRLTGYALLGDSTGAFFGTYAIPSLVHEDPRYRRMQNASIPRRVLHAISRTVIAEHDDGRTMPNYATLLTYPITAELSNLYVPGVQGNGPDTIRRIGLGFATDPITNLLGEFLPDVARHIHLRSVFFQQIVNQMIVGDGSNI